MNNVLGTQIGGCRAVTPFLALAFSRSGHYLRSHIPPALLRILECGESVFRWLAARNFKLSSILKGLLLLSLSAFAVLLSWANLSLGRAIARKVQEVIANLVDDGRQPYSVEELRGLPEPVRRYFKYALQDGYPAITFCSIKQTGMFRVRVTPGLKASDGWKKVNAVQYFTVEEPGYVWVATLQLAPFLYLRGWDSYVKGVGHMLWKLFSAISLIDQQDSSVDRAALARYLSEAVFFPTALLPSHRLKWEPECADSARATLTHMGKSTSAVFHFNKLGQISHIKSSDRPRRLEDGSASEDRWTGYYGDYTNSNGINVPTKMNAVWNLESGDFAYAALCITDNRRWGNVEAKHYLI